MPDDNHHDEKGKGGHLVVLSVLCNVFEQSRYHIDPFGKNDAEIPYGRTDHSAWRAPLPRQMTAEHPRREHAGKPRDVEPRRVASTPEDQREPCVRSS